MFQQFNGYEAKRKIRTMPCKKQNTQQKVAIMKRLLMKLLQTPNDQIVEINTWNDTFWGVCNGVDQDVLGKLLRSMKHGLVRDLIAENA